MASSQSISEPSASGSVLDSASTRVSQALEDEAAWAVSAIRSASSASLWSSPRDLAERMASSRSCSLASPSLPKSNLTDLSGSGTHVLAAVQTRRARRVRLLPPPLVITRCTSGPPLSLAEDKVCGFVQKIDHQKAPSESEVSRHDPTWFSPIQR